jgi:hypothetical protein
MLVLRFVLFLLPVLAACLPRTAHAQATADTAYRYIPFPTDSAEWKVYYEWFYVFDRPEKQLDRLHTSTYTMRGDTVFANGIKASKVYLKITKAINDSAVFIEDTLPYLFLRNEGKKVLKCREFINPNTQQKEYSESILYDFGLIQGETFKPANRMPGKLTLIDTTYETVAGVKRRKLVFSKSPGNFSLTEVWYEGIGSLFGLYESAFSMLDVVDSLYLACFSQGGNSQYLSPALNYCTDSAYYRKSTSSAELLSNQVKVYPSPTNSHLTIKWSTVAGSGIIIIVSGMDGKPAYRATPIHPQASQTEIPVTGWASGIYTVQIQRFGRTVYSQLVTISN